MNIFYDACFNTMTINDLTYEKIALTSKTTTFIVN